MNSSSELCIVLMALEGHS